MSFSATEAAFEGFRVTRQNPLSVLVWAGLWLVGLIVAVMILGPMTMPYASEIEAAQGDVAALSPSAVSALSLGMLAVLPVLLVLQAILAPAVYRAVYAPQAKRIGYLQLGKVELRTLAVVAVLGVLSIVLNLGGEAAVTFSKQVGGVPGLRGQCGGVRVHDLDFGSTDAGRAAGFTTQGIAVPR